MSSTEWESPQDFYDKLNEEFGFTIDVCATCQNTKHKRYYDILDSGLTKDWDNEIFWMNPPYGRGVPQKPWMAKAYSSVGRGATGVCLLPSATDTNIWHDYIMKASEIRFVKDRLHFKLNGISKRANHASVVIVFRPHCQGPPIVSGIDIRGHAIIGVDK